MLRHAACPWVPAYGRVRKVKPYEEVAVDFANALVARDFSRARGLLAPELRRELAERDLQEQLTSMYRGYSDGELSRVQFVPEASLETWPGKRNGDLGQAYASIEGDDFNEAVYVLVCDVGGVPMIREIQWGRP